jgi:hypothetical protein
MNIEAHDLSKVWWRGALTGAAKGLVTGLVVGAAAAVTLQFVLIPLFPMLGLPSIASAFAGFLTLTPGVAGASFSALPLAIFSAVTGTLGNALSSGRIAVNAYKQDVEHRMNEARISQIEQREMALGSLVGTPSRGVQKILASGPRTTTGFRDAEENREQPPISPTVH